MVSPRDFIKTGISEQHVERVMGTNLVSEFTSPVVLTFRYGVIGWYYWIFC